MKQDQDDKYQKINLKEFFSIAKWSLIMMYNINPFLSSLSIATKILTQFNPIIYTYIYAKAIDQLIKIFSTTNTGIESTYPYIVTLGIYYVYSYLLRLVTSNSSGVIQLLSDTHSRKVFYHKLQELGIQNMENPEINNKIYRADNVINRIYNYSEEVITLIAGIIVTCAAAITVFVISPILLVMIAIITIPKYLIDKKYRGMLYKYGYESTEGIRKAYSGAHDLSNSKNLEEISINSTFQFLHKKFIDYFNKHNSHRLTIFKKWWFTSGTISFISNLVLLGGYIKIFTQLAIKKITVGDTAFQMNMLSTFQTSLDGTFTSLNDLLEVSVRMKEAYEIFQMQPAIKDGYVIMPKLTYGPDISFQNIVFSYPNATKLIFNKLNLEIKSGEKIAIVGHNGAGKTTLVKLLARIYTLDSGAIKINNKNLNDLKIDSWYKNLGILFQNYNTYPQLTVKENIYAGKSDEPIDEIGIRLAAINADAISFIEEYPNKFDQILSENYKGGTRPSTGQWQKIAIARFFYRNAPFVIFDEPTAAIDAVSEYNIFNRIYEFFTGKTVIIISHRFSTVRNADRIIVLDKGQIVEQGSHNDLMSHDGYYKKAFMLQAEGYQN